jgi:uncharacterized membrane protein
VGSLNFASPLPWWLAAAVAAAIAAVAYVSYRRPLVPLSVPRRWALTILRGVTLAAIVVFICRPLILRPPSSSADVVVPILVDTSRSMRIADAGGQPRLDRVKDLLAREVLPALSTRFKTEIYAFGDGVVPGDAAAFTAQGRHSDIASAIKTIRDRFSGRRLPGVLLFSDGADTDAAATSIAGGVPVFAAGVGSSANLRDREVLAITASDPGLDQSSIDLRVSAVGRGFGRAPFQLRLLGNGTVLDERRIVPAADGSAVDETFTTAPDLANPTVYTAQVSGSEPDAVPENDTRSVLVSPAGRKRRILAIEGAPAFEHSFLRRAWTLDPGLDVDAVVRKGKNETGESTYFVQAAGGRATLLTSGFPATREALYSYDLVVTANVDGDSLTRAQLGWLSDFVSVRGGGLLVTGSRSFAQHGLAGTPLEEVLPVELGDRRGVARASYTAGGAGYTIALTPDGERHPIMRLGGTTDETRRKWAGLPPMAAAAPLGNARPGGVVLAVTSSPAGVFPVIAVQRYGRGRSMIFGGEASWHWRMMSPSSDRSYDYFWRQAARWLAASAPDPVMASVPDRSEPGDRVELGLDVRDGSFSSVQDATVEATVTGPAGTAQQISLQRDPSVSGRMMAPFTPEQQGLYRFHAEAKRGAAALGQSDRWFYVGGSDREFADPRLNDGILQRVATATGGAYAPASDVLRLLDAIKTATPQTIEPERRDIWHEPWAYGLVLTLIVAEWILRRRWGLR